MGKRILYVASSVGHINAFHLEIIGRLCRLGFSVSVMARGGRDFDIPFEKRIFSLKNLRLIPRIRKILEKERFDAIILNTALASALLRLALPKRIKKTTKLVNIVHGYLFAPTVGVIKRLFFFLVERILASRCDAVITMNSEDFRTAKKYALSKRIFLCDGVGARDVPIRRTREKTREIIGVADAPLITFVGELSRRKNQEFLIKGLKKIREEIPRATLCLVGDGAERDRLSGLVERLSLSDAVIFTGYRDDACDYTFSSDLYASAASVEGLPINVVEAARLGIPLLLSDIKGHRDVLEHGADGELFCFGDADDFARRAVRILKSGKKGKRLFGFEREVCAQRLVEIILEVI